MFNAYLTHFKLTRTLCNKHSTKLLPHTGTIHWTLWSVSQL